MYEEIKSELQQRLLHSGAVFTDVESIYLEEGTCFVNYRLSNQTNLLFDFVLPEDIDSLAELHALVLWLAWSDDDIDTSRVA